MRDAAMKEYFRQPIVDTFDMRICMAKSVKHSVDFSQAHESDLHRIGKVIIAIHLQIFVYEITIQSTTDHIPIFVY